MDAADYSRRQYLSVAEVAAYTGLPVREIHRRVKSGDIPAVKSTSGQYRFVLDEIKQFRISKTQNAASLSPIIKIQRAKTEQVIIRGDSKDMDYIDSESIHLVITSPPYFNAKMYSNLAQDLGNIHDMEIWFKAIRQTWEEVFRVLQPGRKFFLNIMNLPVRINKSFRTLNLCGKSIDLCEDIGFIFKRDIIWHKTNGVRAHFGTYPNPGGILLNHMHEFILEFEKPQKSSAGKYAHVTAEQRAQSKLDKEFWLSLKNSDVWLMKPEKSGSNRSHAAPFPLELPTRLIKAYSFVGETVLDPFLGSGTTLIAADETGRNGVGYEINADFCKMAQESLEGRIL